jgi:hypothetical protein
LDIAPGELPRDVFVIVRSRDDVYIRLPRRFCAARHNPDTVWAIVGDGVFTLPVCGIEVLGYLA